MLEIVTFTGIDRWTPAATLGEIKRDFPKVEFGILIGSNTGKGGHREKNRFPPLDYIEKWRDLWGPREGLSLSLHLCGKYSRLVNEGKGGELFKLIDGFDRVQVNSVKYNTEHVARFADRAPCRSVILQHRNSFSRVPVNTPRIEYLFDKSGGRGEAGHEWPQPMPSKRTGFAGGIRPDNVVRVQAWCLKYHDYRLWIDMESGVRNIHDKFCVATIRQVCRNLWGDRDPDAKPIVQPKVGMMPDHVPHRRHTL